MNIQRHYTVGAVARDLRALKALDEGPEASGVAPAALVVLSRRRDERMMGVTLPEGRTRRVESGLSRMQCFEFASAFLGVTAVSILMGAVPLPTGLALQSLMTLAAFTAL